MIYMIDEIHNRIKWKKKYHTVGTFPKPNAKVAENCKIDTPNTQIDDRWLFWLVTDNTIKSGGAKLVLWTHIVHSSH
jgi:hypothetical protein